MRCNRDVPERDNLSGTADVRLHGHLLEHADVCRLDDLSRYGDMPVADVRGLPDLRLRDLSRESGMHHDV
jgi:hypothetical protein